MSSEVERANLIVLGVNGSVKLMCIFVIVTRTDNRQFASCFNTKWSYEGFLTTHTHTQIICAVGGRPLSKQGWGKVGVV